MTNLIPPQDTHATLEGVDGVTVVVDSQAMISAIASTGASKILAGLVLAPMPEGEVSHVRITFDAGRLITVVRCLPEGEEQFHDHEYAYTPGEGWTETRTPASEEQTLREEATE